MMAIISRRRPEVVLYFLDARMTDYRAILLAAMRLNRGEATPRAQSSKPGESVTLAHRQIAAK